MSRLDRYISSSYVSAANALNGKSSRRKIVAYVESYDDVFFWRTLLSQLETPGRCFHVMLPSKGRKLERGKRAALMAVLRDSVGPDMIACVDADYDYLKQGTDSLSKLVCDSPYVFHTYAYAIENLQCWAPALHDVCVMATLNDSPDMPDFPTLFASYSETIYPLFVWSILCARQPQYAKFDIHDFMTVIKTGTIVRWREEEMLQRVAEKVRKKLNALQKTTSAKAQKAYARLDGELRTLGVAPDETYLYVQGHQLLSDMVLPMLTKVCDHLVQQRENEIRRESRHGTQQVNELSCYAHSVAKPASMLKKQTLFLHSPQAGRILADLNKMLNT